MNPLKDDRKEKKSKTFEHKMNFSSSDDSEINISTMVDDDPFMKAMRDKLIKSKETTHAAEESLISPPSPRSVTPPFSPPPYSEDNFVENSNSGTIEKKIKLNIHSKKLNKEFVVYLNKPFTELIKQCCITLDIKSCSLIFDGEIIDSNKTPAYYDLEDEDQVDLRINDAP